MEASVAAGSGQNNAPATQEILSFDHDCMSSDGNRGELMMREKLAAETSLEKRQMQSPTLCIKTTHIAAEIEMKQKRCIRFEDQLKCTVQRAR
jgi:hypothetical protein